MMQPILTITREIGVTGFLDAGLMALLIYGLLVWLRRTRRAGLILGGILILGAIYLAASRLGLILTTAVLKAFFAVFVIMLVVIFQEELRHLFEQIAKWGLSHRLPGGKTSPQRLPRSEVAILTRTLSDLARDRIGALVVITGSDSIMRHIDGGEEVHGKLSEPLLKSVFDPHSMGHDGAMIIKGATVMALGVHLPLSRELETLGARGTRHAAALGLSERTDALCVAVSEERGTISVARAGQLEVIDSPHALGKRIEAFYEEVSPEQLSHPWRTFFLRNYREKLVAVIIAAALWFALVYRTGEVIDRTVNIVVEHTPAPAGMTVLRLSPDRVSVDVSGPRQLLKALQPSDMRLQINLAGVTEGVQMIPIHESAFILPKEIEISDMTPRQVMVNIRVDSAPTPGTPTGIPDPAENRPESAGVGEGGEN